MAILGDTSMDTKTVEYGTDHATASRHTPPPVGWQGPLVPLNVSSGGSDRRVVASRVDVKQALSRYLPLPLKFQEVSAAAHDNAICGLATITRVWEQDDAVWGSGPFNLSDPRGVELANKVRDGFLGWVSVELDASEYRTERGPDGQPVSVFDDWRIAGATLVADAAFNEARIFAVTTADTITSSNDAVRELAGTYGITDFSPIDYRQNAGLVLTFSKTPVFAAVGDTDLPWAPREHPWDGSAAASRVATWANNDPSRMSRAFAYRDDEANPETIGAYKLGFADVIDGQLRAVFSGLAAAAGRFNQTDMPTDERDRVAGVLRSLYRKAADAFDDDTITAPDNIAGTETMSRGENMAEEMLPVDIIAEPESSDDADLSDEQLASVVEQITPMITELVTNLVAQQTAENQASMSRRSEINDIFARLDS